MVRAFQNIYGQVRECLGPDSRRTLREGKLPAAFHRLARAIDANRTLAAFVALILFGLIAGGAMFHTTSAIAAGGGGIGSPGSVVTPIAVPTDDDDRSVRCVSALIKHGQIASEKINLCNVRRFIEIAPVKLHPINQVAPLPNETSRLNGKLMG